MQDGILRIFIIIIITISYRHLLKNARTARKQFKVLRTYLDLGSHAQAFNIVKDFSRLKFIIY